MQQIWTCVLMLASLLCMLLRLPFKFHVVLYNTTEGQNSSHLLWRRTGADFLPELLESKWGAANIKPTVAGKIGNTECFEQGGTAAIPFCSQTMGLCVLNLMEFYGEFVYSGVMYSLSAKFDLPWCPFLITISGFSNNKPSV